MPTIRGTENDLLFSQGEVGLPGELGESGFQGDKVFRLKHFVCAPILLNTVCMCVFVSVNERILTMSWIV